MRMHKGILLSAGLLALSTALPTHAAPDDEATQVREQCESQPEIKALHFGARKDALKKCVDTELEKRHAVREAAQQAELAKLSPVHRYAVCVTHTGTELTAYLARLEYQTELSRARLHEDPDDHAYDASKKQVSDMHECLDAKLPAASAEASTDDLKKAIKDYYVASASLLDSMSDSAGKRAQATQAFDEANNRLHLEAVAAGKW